MYRTSCAAHRAERPGRYAVRPGRQPPHPGQRPSAGLACVTGRFQPVHHQHLDLFEIALREAGYLIVAVTNPEPRRPPRENHTGTPASPICQPIQAGRARRPPPCRGRARLTGRCFSVTASPPAPSLRWPTPPPLPAAIRPGPVDPRDPVYQRDACRVVPSQGALTARRRRHNRYPSCHPIVGGQRAARGRIAQR